MSKIYSIVVQPETQFTGGSYGNYMQASTPRRSIWRRKPVLFGVIALFVVVGIALASTTISSRQNNSKLADQFIDYYLASNTQASYELFDLQTKNGLTQDDWTTDVGLKKGFFTTYTPEGSEELSGELKSYSHTYILKGKDGLYIADVVTSESSGQAVVTSFSIDPYIDTEGRFNQ